MSLRLRDFLVLTAVFMLTSTNVFGYFIEHVEKLTIIKFTPEDFQNANIEDDAGWRLGCLIETPPFNVPVSQDTEIEILWNVYGRWEKNFLNAEQLSKHFLAVLELNFVDKYDHSHFEPKMLKPMHLGPAQVFFTSTKGFMDMHGDSSNGPQVITQGPIMLGAGTKKITAGLCDVAPDTSFQLRELQIRLRPL